MKASRLFAFLLVLALPAAPVWGANEVSRHVVGSGGGTSASTSHAVEGTVGQPAVGGASSASHGVGAGFWNGVGVVIGIADPPLPIPPLTFRLYQNVPNPVLSRTTVRFDVPDDGAHVVLRIYNLRGALVRTLVEGPQSAGEKSVDWNGLDQRGGRTAAGVYLYVLDTPGQRFIRKLAVLH